MEITFHNVQITVEAKNAKEAYNLLCQALATIKCEWDTDTYSSDKVSYQDTAELFPSDND